MNVWPNRDSKFAACPSATLCSGMLCSLVLCSVLLLLATGCVQKQTVCDQPILPVHTAFHEAPIETRPIRRVVILPVENRAGSDPKTLEHFQHAVASAIREQQVYEIIEIPAHLRPRCSPQWVQQGMYPDQVLADMYRNYNADAVLFVSINQFSAYPPAAIAATVHLVDSDEGMLLSTVEGSWSVDNPNVAGAMQRKIQTEQSPERAKLLMKSPRFVADFVADEIAAELSNRKSSAIQYGPHTR